MWVTVAAIDLPQATAENTTFGCSSFYIHFIFPSSSLFRGSDTCHSNVVIKWWKCCCSGFNYCFIPSFSAVASVLISIRRTAAEKEIVLCLGHTLCRLVHLHSDICLTWYFWAKLSFFSQSAWSSPPVSMRMTMMMIMMMHSGDAHPMHQTDSESSD